MRRLAIVHAFIKGRPGEAQAIRFCFLCRYFANGELDDFGGTIPPLCAGLEVSYAEEEALVGNIEYIFSRLDSHAKEVSPNVGLTGGIAKLAEELAKECNRVGELKAYDQLQVLRVMYAWVAHHVIPPPRLDTLDVDAPLLGPNFAKAEAALLGELTGEWRCTAPLSIAARTDHDLVAPVSLRSAALVLFQQDRRRGNGCGDIARGYRHCLDLVPRLTDARRCCVAGTWAERVATLLLQLLRVFITNSYTINGFWKNGSGPKKVLCTNHMWVGVKVNRGWRLVDVARAVVRRGFASFFVPPEAFIYSYYPLKASWQLLGNGHKSLQQFWEMPHCSVEFFSNGLALAAPKLRAENVLQPVTQGQPLPSVCIQVAEPQRHDQWVVTRLLDQNKKVRIHGSQMPGSIMSLTLTLILSPNPKCILDCSLALWWSRTFWPKPSGKSALFMLITAIVITPARSLQRQLVWASVCTPTHKSCCCGGISMPATTFSRCRWV